MTTSADLSTAPYPESTIDDYDLIYRHLPDVHQWASFLGRIRPNVADLLEFGAGTGRLTAPLARSGLSIVGVDLSAPMLDRLRTRTAGLPVRAVQADFTQMRLGQRFDVVLIATNTLFMLTSASDKLAALQSGRAHLAHGGALVIQHYAPWIFTERPADHRIVVPLTDAAELTVRSRVDVVRQRVDIDQLVVDSNGKRVTHEVSVWCSPAQLDALAGEAGLRLESRWGDLDGRPWSERTPDIVSVYRPYECVDSES